MVRHGWGARNGIGRPTSPLPGSWRPTSSPTNEASDVPSPFALSPPPPPSTPPPRRASQAQLTLTLTPTLTLTLTPTLTLTLTPTLTLILTLQARAGLYSAAAVVQTSAVAACNAPQPQPQAKV
eukprot:scaffold20780_cov57-Phaeocystis_antarctica.AAC.4